MECTITFRVKGNDVERVKKVLMNLVMFGPMFISNKDRGIVVSFAMSIKNMVCREEVSNGIYAVLSGRLKRSDKVYYLIEDLKRESEVILSLYDAFVKGGKDEIGTVLMEEIKEFKRKYKELQEKMKGVLNLINEEIIVSVIDDELAKAWRKIRNIEDELTAR